jgi:hypothetical protein
MQIFDYSYNPDPHQSETKTKVTVTAQNVAGYLDNGAAKTVIIGAHYDHLGLNERHHSTAPNAKNEIHNGADDNASGVSAMMELARIFSQNNVKEKSNFVFVAFSGEEDGLIGSKHFADIMKEKFPAPSVMLNMDMVGRLDSMKNFNIHGVGTGDGFVDLVNRLKPAGFNLSLDSSGVGPSDHTSFYLKDIPVLFFFTGLHTDYHKPSDDTEKINFRGLQLTTEYVLRIAEALSEKEKIAFFKTKLQSTDKKVAKYKVTLGVMPDYKDYGDGLHIESVIEGRTAQKAGLTDGDIVIKLGDCEIKEVYAYMECLSKFNAGDETTITFKRNGEVKTAKIKF